MAKNPLREIPDVYLSKDVSGVESRSKYFSRNRSRIVAGIGAGLVFFVYAMPFLLNAFGQNPPLNILVRDEKIYLARVVDAYFGGTLGNPYLAEHQNAEKIMPELTERLFAFAAHSTDVGPLGFIAISRVVCPVLIFLVMWSLARALGMSDRWALLAAVWPPFVPTISWIKDLTGLGYLRYVRAISPAFYVLLLVLALRLVLFAWQSRYLWSGIVAGASLGLLFYTTPYYWIFAALGTAWLAISSKGARRKNLTLCCIVGGTIGLFPIVHSVPLTSRQDVRETLTRLDLMTPGRTPDVDVMPRFILGAVIAIFAALWRKKLGATAQFVIPFLLIGPCLMVQNVVTNRHLQGAHWVECLIPVWGLLAAAFFQAFDESIRSLLWLALFVTMTAQALVPQILAYERWKTVITSNPDFWILDKRMPQTLQWLVGHTPVQSIVLADPDIMDSLVLYTRNKVYWADYASQHVMLEQEVDSRTASLAAWQQNEETRLPFPADFYLKTGAECETFSGGRILFRSESERTCVFSSGLER